MARRFIFRNSPMTRAASATAPAVSHPSGFGITASEKDNSLAEKMAKTSQADIHDAREWLKRLGADEAVAMFDATTKG